MWRVAFVFVVLFPYVAFAECVSVDAVTKCARLPEFFSIGSLDVSGKYTDASWEIVYSDVVYSGNSAECTGNGLDGLCRCEVDSPFDATILFATGPFLFDSAYQACAYMRMGEMTESYTFNAKSDNDACPDGFYTVPYNVSCGEGMVDVADVPYCDDDMSGDYCLMLASAAPCAAGVTTLRTGTGVSVPLWAEKSTEPSLCVKYNEMVCYADLELGQVTNGININYNNLIYHLVD